VLLLSADTAMLSISQHPRAIEMNLGLYASSGEVRRPERLYHLLALRGERRKVTAFETAKAKRYALHREAMETLMLVMAQ
jgi:hypothetical protein